MATILVCVALSLGSVLGVTARTMNAPSTMKEVYDPITQEYIQVASDPVLNPLDILKTIGNP